MLFVSWIQILVVPIPDAVSSSVRRAPMDQETRSKAVSTPTTVSTNDVARDVLAAKLKAPTKATRRIRYDLLCEVLSKEVVD